MSLSSPQPAESKNSGRVIMGMDSGVSELSLGQLQGKSRTGWTDKDHEEYHRRVCERAEAAAKDILSGAMAEAKVLREQAQVQGFQEGQAQCQAQVDEIQNRSAEILAQALAAAQQTGQELGAERQKDIVTLVRMAVEKTLAVEMQERRTEILGALLDQALEAIDSHRGLTVRVNPQDQEIAADLLERAKAHHSGLDRWRVRPDDGIGGGVILESAQGMADNAIEERWQVIEPILDCLGQSDACEAANEAGAVCEPAPEAPVAPSAPAQPEPEVEAAAEPPAPVEEAEAVAEPAQEAEAVTEAEPVAEAEAVPEDAEPEQAPQQAEDPLQAQVDDLFAAAEAGQDAAAPHEEQASQADDYLQDMLGSEKSDEEPS